MPEARIAVGDPNGRRSTVWKFVTHADEAYILTRMFGREAKVSLHSSGQCQWSATGDWVIAEPGRRNADRHFKKWEAPRPTSGSGLHMFRVRIPASELRVVGSQEDLAEVVWLAEPEVGETTVIDCFITPVIEAQPQPGPKDGRKHLFSLPLNSGRWFVVFEEKEIITTESLEAVRLAGWENARQAGIEAQPNMRAAAFVEWDSNLRGLIELCPPNAAELPRWA
jgi:hypothetical protein